MTNQRNTLCSRADLGADNSFAPPLRIQGWDPNLGRRPFDVAISGTFTGTLSLQASYDEGQTWIDSGDVWTEPGVHVCEVATPCLVRCGFKAGAWASGAATVRIAQ